MSAQWFEWLWGVPVGLATWILAEWVGKPIRRGYDLATAARTEMYRYANVELPYKENRQTPERPHRVESFTDAHRDRLKKAQDTYRDFAVQLVDVALRRRRLRGIP